MLLTAKTVLYIDAITNRKNDALYERNGGL